MNPQPLQAGTLSSPEGVPLAYRRRGGTNPGVVFLGGFMSDMTGSKALHLENHCQASGQAFVRFDYSGHGASGGRFQEGTIGRWLGDALTVLDNLTVGPQILVGSSMGGWMMLLVALARPERVAGLVGLASAADFTEDLMWAVFDEDARYRLLEEGAVYVPSDRGAPYPVTRALIEEGRSHLLLRAPIPLTCPVRLIHGMADPDVPWQTSQRLLEQLAGTDVSLTLLKEGDHRLSREGDLRLLSQTLAELTATIGGARSSR